MLAAAGGGGYSGTDWYGYDVAEMWSMLKDQQTDNHWKQISGWQKTYELTSTHLFRLQEYRDNLVEAWDPKKSPAAKTYVDRLNYLIDNVQQTYDAAISNYTTASGAISALTMARYELEQVYNDYAKKKQALDNTPSSVPSSEMPTPSPSPGPSPTAKAEIERLNNKARGIMFKLGGELSLAQAQIKPPPVYKPSTKIDNNSNPDVYGGGGGTPPPPIPPIMTVPTGGYSPSGGYSSPSGGYSVPPHASGPPLQIVPTPTPPSTGPILGGAGPLAPPVTPPIQPPVITPPAPPLPPPGTGYLPPIPPGMPPGYGPFNPPTTFTPTIVSPTNGGLIKPVMGGPAGVPRAMPPGGMIGGVPGAGLGQPGTPASPARRINPVGGVIGGERTGSGMTGGARGGAGTGRSPMASGGRAAGRRSEDEHGQHWDPDNPWETDEGVAPVVLPSHETGRIDPGPAIGFHR